jgi:DNA polymerase sigma
MANVNPFPDPSRAGGEQQPPLPLPQQPLQQLHQRPRHHNGEDHDFITLDISIQNHRHDGIQSLTFMRNQVTLPDMTALRPLCLVLKMLLAERGLNNAFSGGLSSFGLFLIVTFVLQKQKSLASGTRKRHWSLAHGRCGLAHLLMEFLSFYGMDFDPQQHGLSVREGG